MVKSSLRACLLLTIIMMIVATNICAVAKPLRHGVIDERLRSLRVEHSANGFMPNVVTQGSDDAIDISFDILGDEMEYLRYRLVHCDADWTPSALTDFDIIDGFNEGIIDDYEYSQGTTQGYVHYRFRALGPDMRPRFSGNYLVEIYSEENPEKTLARVRTGVSKGAVDVMAKCATVTDIDYNDRHQQLEITITDRDNAVENIYNDLIVKVSQNRREDRLVTLRQPLKSTGRSVTYAHVPELIFPAGNEYRRFETVSTRYLPMGVESISFQAPYYRFVLQPDIPKIGQSYLYDQTQHGRFKIRNADILNPSYGLDDYQADYGVVYFRLQMPETLGKIHIIGDFNGQTIGPDSEMAYNPATGQYEKALLLKQGAYNYQYVCENSKGEISQCIDGNHFETVNEYEIKIYQRRRGDRADSMIGVYSFKTAVGL